MRRVETFAQRYVFEELVWPGNAARSSTSTRRPNSARRCVVWSELDHVPVDDDLAGILEMTVMR